MPAAQNRIEILPDKHDELGVPIARITYDYLPNDLAAFDAATANLRRVLEASGASEVHISSPPFEAHPMGSMRMGREPRTSVTDHVGRVHGVDNLFVGGAALFPSGSSVNPTLTIHALALRTAEHIVRRREEVLGG